VPGILNAESVAIDLANDELWADNAASNTLAVYPRTASGSSATPIRVIGASPIGLWEPQAIAADRTHDELFVFNGYSRDIDIYASSATGTAASPVRTIHTSLGGPIPLAYDEANDRIAAVEDSGQISTWPRTASPNAQQTYAAFTRGRLASAIAFDAAHGEAFVRSLAHDGIPSTGQIEVFTVEPSFWTPARSIVETVNNTGNIFYQALGYDGARDEIWVLDGNEARVYPRTASGPTAALRTLALGPSYTTAYGLSVGQMSELFVSYGSAIQVYDGAATPAPTLLRTISGPTTMLQLPWALAPCR
jgi:hypothetical protein